MKDEDTAYEQWRQAKIDRDWDTLPSLLREIPAVALETPCRGSIQLAQLIATRGQGCCHSAIRFRTLTGGCPCSARPKRPCGRYLLA